MQIAVGQHLDCIFLPDDIAGELGRDFVALLSEFPEPDQQSSANVKEKDGRFEAQPMGRFRLFEID